MASWHSGVLSCNYFLAIFLVEQVLTRTPGLLQQTRGQFFIFTFIFGIIHSMSEVYERDSLIVAYAKWHYGQGLRELFGVAQNFLWFVAHFFSFKLLLRTLFSPWKRLGENYGGGFDLAAFASTLVVNTLMRVVGLVTRLIILLIGSVSYLFVFIFAFFIVLVWIFAPFILLGSAVLSITFFSV